MLSIPGYDRRIICEVVGQVVLEDETSMEARRALGELVEKMRGAQLGGKPESLKGVTDEGNDQGGWQMNLVLR